MKKLFILCLMTLSLLAVDVKHLNSSITTGQASSETPHVELTSSSAEAKTSWKIGPTTNIITLQQDTASINSSEYIDSIIDFKMIGDAYTTEYIDVKPFFNGRELKIKALNYDEKSYNAGVYIKPNILKGMVQFKYSYGYDEVLDQDIERSGIVGGYKTKKDGFVFLYSYEKINKDKQDTELLLQYSAEYKLSDTTAIIAKRVEWENSYYWYDNTLVAFKIYIK